VKDFEAFYRTLPGMLAGNLKRSFAPVLSTLQPRSEDNWVTILDDEMLALLNHPEIDWSSVSTYQDAFSNMPIHPLNDLFLKMSLYDPLPLNPEIAHALSQRLGAEGAASLFIRAHLSSGRYPGSHMDQQILLMRYAGFVGLIPGVLDHLVDHYFTALRGNEMIQHMSPDLVKNPRLKPSFWALSGEQQAIPFSLTTLLAVLCALDPKSVRASVERYIDDMPPALWVRDFMSFRWGPNGQTIEAGMRFVLHHLQDPEALHDFLAYGLTRQADSTIHYEDLSSGLRASLAITLLRFGRLDELHRLYETTSSPFLNGSLIEDAVNLDWDVLDQVRQLPDSNALKSGFWAYYQDKRHLTALLQEYSGKDYLPRSTSQVFQHLINTQSDQPFLAQWLETAISKTKSISPIPMHRLTGFLKIFRGVPYLAEVFRASIGNEKPFLKRVFNQIESPRNFDQYVAVEFVKTLIDEGIYTREQVYASIPSIQCLKLLNLDEEEICRAKRMGSPALKREILEAEINP